MHILEEKKEKNSAAPKQKDKIKIYNKYCIENDDKKSYYRIQTRTKGEKNMAVIYFIRTKFEESLPKRHRNNKKRSNFD